MSIAGYLTPDIASCIDNDKLSTAFDSLRVLTAEARQGLTKVQCTEIDTTLSGTDSLESCVTLIDKSFSQQLTLNPEKCLFLLNFKYSPRVIGNPAGVVVSTLSYTLKCDGNIVGTGALEPEQITASVLEIDCPPGREVELCATASITQTGVGLGNSPGTFSVDWNLQACGARACFSKIDISSPQSWIPASVKSDGCYDSSAIALMVQNINALSQSFSNGGQSVLCRSIQTTGNESVPVAVNLDTPTTFIAFGTVKVCIDNPQSGDSVTVSPIIGCESAKSQCISGVFKVPEEGSPIADCIEFPVIACGECPAGESIFVGQQPNGDCRNRNEAQAANFGFEVTGDYCVWLFSQVNNGTLRLPYPPRCLTTDYMQSLQDSFDTVHTLACNRSVPNCTTRRVTESHPLDEIITIQEALEPPNPIPDDWPGIKKWTLFGTVSAFSAPTTVSLEQRITATISYQIKCGGDVILESPEIPWQLVESGAFNPQSPILTITGNVECIQNAALEICAIVSDDNAGTGWTVQTSVTAICF